MDRLKKYYDHVVRYDMAGRETYTNVMQTPKIDRVVLNIGCNTKAVGTDPRKRTRLTGGKGTIPALFALELITGQKPNITRAKKSIDRFKLRQKMPIGCKVTLRNQRMHGFLDRLVNQVLPVGRPNVGTGAAAAAATAAAALGTGVPVPAPAPDPVPVPVPGWNGDGGTACPNGSGFAPAPTGSGAGSPAHFVPKVRTVPNRFFGSNFVPITGTSSSIGTAPRAVSLTFGIAASDLARFREMERQYERFDPLASAAYGMDIVIVIKAQHSCRKVRSTGLLAAGGRKKASKHHRALLAQPRRARTLGRAPNDRRERKLPAPPQSRLLEAPAGNILSALQIPFSSVTTEAAS